MAVSDSNFEETQPLILTPKRNCALLNFYILRLINCDRGCVLHHRKQNAVELRFGVIFQQCIRSYSSVYGPYRPHPWFWPWNVKKYAHWFYGSLRQRNARSVFPYGHISRYLYVVSKIWKPKSITTKRLKTWHHLTPSLKKTFQQTMSQRITEGKTMAFNVTAELKFVTYYGFNWIKGVDSVTGRGSGLLLRGWLPEMVPYLVCSQYKIMKVKNNCLLMILDHRCMG